MNGRIAGTFPRCRSQGRDWIAYTDRSRVSTTPFIQTLNTPSMLISPDSKRGQGSRGSGAPGADLILTFSIDVPDDFLGGSGTYDRFTLRQTPSVAEPPTFLLLFCGVIGTVVIKRLVKLERS